MVLGRLSNLPCCAPFFHGTPVTGHRQLELIFLVCVEHGYQIANILEAVSVIDSIQGGGGFIDALPEYLLPRGSGRFLLSHSSLVSSMRTFLTPK